MLPSPAIAYMGYEYARAVIFKRVGYAIVGRMDETDFSGHRVQF